MDKALNIIKKGNFKDPGSAITHLIGMLLSMVFAIPLLYKAVHDKDSTLTIVSLAIFILSMILLYAASTSYHTFDINPKVNKILKKIDHMMIFVLIAGSYTPICLVVVGDKTGWILMGFVWIIAIIGILIKAFWIFCPKWFSSLLYIGMGWICVLAISKIISALSFKGFMWLVVGGIIYTIGGIIYALKLPMFNKRHKNFGSHEIFHLFVLGGSFCHYMLMYSYIA